MNKGDDRRSERGARRMQRLVLLPAIAFGAITAVGTYEVAGQGSKTVWDGIYNEGQAARGKQLYVGNCSACHMAVLQGADLAPALKGDGFVLRWSDSSVDDLVTSISSSMPADSPGSLTAQQYVDIVTYLLNENKFPAGKEEIGADAALLKTIVITKQSAAR